MNLKELANKYTALDGAVTFWLLPYQTAAVSRCLSKMMALEGDNTEQWGGELHIFTIALPLTVDIEIADHAPPDIQALRYFMANRNGSFESNLDLFRQVVSHRVVELWAAAYSATRPTAMDADKELTEALPEDADEDQKKSGTRRGRRSKNTSGSG